MQTSLSTNIRSCLVINQSATCFSPSPAPVPRGGCQLGFRRSVFNTGGGFSGQAVSGRRFLFAFREHFPRGGKPFASLMGKVRKERHVATLSALCPTHPFMSLCPPPLPNVPLAGLSEATIHSKKNSFISDSKSRYNFQMVPPADKRDNGGTERKDSFSSITLSRLELSGVALQIPRSKTGHP